MSYNDDLVVYFEKGTTKTSHNHTWTKNWTVLNGTGARIPFKVIEKDLDKKMKIRISAE